MDTDKKFTGQRLDQTVLYFYNARYYDATIGRFISPDPITHSRPLPIGRTVEALTVSYLGSWAKGAGKEPNTGSIPAVINPQEHNRYSYCINNPLRYVDTLGNQAEQAGQIPQIVQSAEQLAQSLEGVPYVGEAAAIVAGGCFIIWSIFGHHAAVKDNNPVKPQPLPTPPSPEEEKNQKEFKGTKPDLPKNPGEKPGGEGWEWKGKGSPESGKGNWVRKTPDGKEEQLHPDLGHGGEEGPHYDYTAPDGSKWRIDLYGNISPK